MKIIDILDTLAFFGMLVGIPCLLGAGTVGLRADTPPPARAVMFALGGIGLASALWGAYRCDRD
jgi:hypothetical protein